MTATGAQLAARLHHAAMACDRHPWLGAGLHAAVDALEQDRQWRLALARYAGAVYPDCRRPYQAAVKIAADLVRFETGYRRILAGAKRPNSIEALLFPLMGGPKSYRAIGDALKIHFQLGGGILDADD